MAEQDKDLGVTMSAEHKEPRVVEEAPRPRGTCVHEVEYTAKVDKTLYREMKKILIDGGFTVGQYITAAEWLMWELIHKRANHWREMKTDEFLDFANHVTCAEVDGDHDWYEDNHKAENAPL